MIIILAILTFLGLVGSFTDPAPFIFIIIVDVLYCVYKTDPYHFFFWYPQKQKKMRDDYLHWFNYEQPHYYSDEKGRIRYIIYGYEGTWIERELDKYLKFLITQQKEKLITPERAKWKYKKYKSDLEKNYQKYVVNGTESSEEKYHNQLTKGLF